MPSLVVGDVYIHPNADSSVAPQLEGPSPIRVHGALCGSPPKSGDWSVGVLGITGTPWTELWFWSSAEGAPTINVDEVGEGRFRSAYVQFEWMLKLISKMYPMKETLRRIAVLENLVFSKNCLPPPDSRAQVIGSKYIFKEVAVEDLNDVVETSTVVRIKASLAAASSTGAYLASSEDRRAQVWCFKSREGAISSVYVRPEVRGMGLGKETMRKGLEKGFV